MEFNSHIKLPILLLVFYEQGRRRAEKQKLQTIRSNKWHYTAIKSEDKKKSQVSKGKLTSTLKVAASFD